MKSNLDINGVPEAALEDPSAFLAAKLPESIDWLMDLATAQQLEDVLRAVDSLLLDLQSSGLTDSSDSAIDADAANTALSQSIGKLQSVLQKMGAKNVASTAISGILETYGVLTDETGKIVEIQTQRWATMRQARLDGTENALATDIDGLQASIGLLEYQVAFDRLAELDRRRGGVKQSLREILFTPLKMPRIGRGRRTRKQAWESAQA